jgi:Cu/Ag efflux pump CusA
VLAACGHGAASAPPDRVQILVDAPGHAVDLERTVTIPLERALAGVPVATRTRSVTRDGHVVFTIDVRGDMLAARQEILARLPAADLPAGVHAELGPLTSADGEVVRYALHTSTLPLFELRTIQDWTARPALLRVAGVADVSTCGGAVAQLRIHAGLDQLLALNVGLDDVASAVHDAAARDLVRDADEVRALVVAKRGDVAVRLGDVALVEDGGTPETCYALDARGRGVISTVWLRTGDDRATVRAAVDRALDQLAAQLPPGTTLDRPSDVARGTLAFPPGASDAKRRELVQQAASTVPDAAIELGRPDGGFADRAPDEARVYLKSRDDLKRVADAPLPGARWAADEPGAWIEVTGDEFDQLAAVLDRVTAVVPVVARIGAGTLPELTYDIDRQAAARLGVDLGAIQDTLETLQHPRALGTIRRADRTVDITLELRGADPEHAMTVPVRAGSTLVPISELVKIEERAEPDAIVRDNGRRMAMARVADRDVAALRGKLASIALPPGYTLAVEPAP